MKIKLDPGAICPTRAHEYDAGLDLYSREDKTIYAGESAVFDTGVHIALSPCTAGFINSKSGLNVKHGITSDGVVDTGFTGSIVVKLYNHSDKSYQVKAGDKITQLVVVRIDLPGVTVVDELETRTERGDNGFGSTGR